VFVITFVALYQFCSQAGNVTRKEMGSRSAAAGVGMAAAMLTAENSDEEPARYDFFYV